MTNPLVHALVIAAAVVIPGGLIVYFAWLAYKARAKKNQHPAGPSPDQARAAFMAMYPRDSLRARSRREQLDRMQRVRRRKSSDE